MEKTINIIVEETKLKIAKAVEESNLPVSILDMIMKDIYNEIHTLAIELTTKEMREYQNANLSA